MQSIDWLLTYVWEVWLDKIFDKYSQTQSENICFAR